MKRWTYKRKKRNFKMRLIFIVGKKYIKNII